MKRYVLRTIEKPYKYVGQMWQLDDFKYAQIYRKSTAYKYVRGWNRHFYCSQKGLVDIVPVEIKESEQYEYNIQR